MGKVVGIDLGTTFSAIAHVNDHGQPEVITNDDNDRSTPSVIWFDEDNIITIGKDAKANARAVPEEIVEFVKREMGQSKEEFFREFNGKAYSAEELSALILAQLKKDAEVDLNTEVTDAVITVPAYFKEAEREATRNAGKIAGLNVLQVMNEPSAAALAYGVDQLNSEQTVFVFDLGGGTFDVTVMKISESKVQMLATDGDQRLGGKDWDDKIIQHVAEIFENEHGEKPLEDLATYQDFQSRAIEAKHVLSKKQKTTIVCGYNGNFINVELTREKFEELTVELVKKCRDTCTKVLSESEIAWEDIDTLLLVGGSTRMPMVQEMIAAISGKADNPQRVNPDEAVALGAAIQGTFHQLIDPDPTVAENISEETRRKYYGPHGISMTVIDGATHNLGIVIVNDQREKIIHLMIPKMTPVPCEVSDRFGTVEANMNSVLIEVVQALEQDQLVAELVTAGTFDDEYKIGECTLELPSGLPKGAPIDVTYKYNDDQILEVRAKGPDGRTVNAEFESKVLGEDEVEQAATELKRLEFE